MQIQTLTIQPIAPVGAATSERPAHAFVMRAARRLSIVAAVLAATTAVLAASVLAVVMNLR
jgi:hypothetical protein